MKAKDNLFNISSASIAGIRKINEDACWVGCNAHKQCMAIVCDGIGSQEGSQNASRFIVDFFREEFSKRKRIFFINTWFKITLDLAWKALKNKYLKTESPLGTTLVVAIISKNTVYCYHIGDSRLYYYSIDDKHWYKKTVDHNLYNMLERKHAPEDMFLKNKDRLLSLTNFIDSQTNKFMEYSSCKINVKPGDSLLLCSDGLYNYLKINKIANLIALYQGNNFSEITSNLVQEALLNGSNDNITCVLIEINK